MCSSWLKKEVVRLNALCEASHNELETRLSLSDTALYISTSWNVHMKIVNTLGLADKNRARSQWSRLLSCNRQLPLYYMRCVLLQNELPLLGRLRKLESITTTVDIVCFIVEDRWRDARERRMTK